MELTISKPGTALWREMKENARIASNHPNAKRKGKARREGGMEIIAKYAGQALKKLGASAKSSLEVHVVAHSAGSIFAGHAMRHLVKLGPAFSSLQFLAPAIAVREFKELIYPRVRAGECPQPSLYLLSDSGERDDNVGPYGRSLLYLVSNSFEGRRETPLLGMERFIHELPDGSHGDIDPDVRKLFSNGSKRGPSLVVSGREYSIAKDEPAAPLSQSETHGGFDNDPVTLNEVLRRMIGARPQRPFTIRDLQY